MDWDGTRIDEIFSGHDRNGPGYAVGVVQDGELVHAAGYGSADLEHDVPITPDSVFDIGSTSKQFTAAATLLLADEGCFRLDDSICTHLPVLPTGVFGDVTVRDLVHHTSGIPDYLALMTMSGRPMSNDYEEEELVDLLAGQQGLDFPPGTAFSYSNSGYLLLAELVRATSGESLRTVAERRLFAPAGMASTFCHDDFAEVVPGRAVGYAPGPSGSWSIDVPLLDVLGDGAVYTTVPDLARWDAQFSTCTLPAGPDFTQRLTTPGRLRDGTPLAYAFGLFVDTYRGTPRVQHGGAWGGYRAQLTRFPELRTSIIVLANHGSARVDSAVAAVAEVALGPRLAPVETAPTQHHVRQFSLGDRAGTYVDGRASFAVSLRDGEQGPVLEVGDQQLPLQPLTDDRLRSPDAGLDLTLTEHGLEVSGSSLGPIRMHRQDAAAPGPEALAQLAGRYRSDELGADLVLRVEDGGLSCRIGWSPWRRLRPLGGRLFFTDGLVVRLEDAASGVLTLGSLRSRLQRFHRAD